MGTSKLLSGLQLPNLRVLNTGSYTPGLLAATNLSLHASVNTSAGSDLITCCILYIKNNLHLRLAPSPDYFQPCVKISIEFECLKLLAQRPRILPVCFSKVKMMLLPGTQPLSKVK